MKIQYRIICLILIVLVLSFFVVINASGEKKQSNNRTTKIVTTQAMSSDVLFKDVIYEKKEKKEVNVKEYNSYLGFSFDYILEYFSLDILSNNTILLSDLNDENNYLKIEKLNEIDYYKETEKKDEELVDGFYKKYHFIKGKDLFLKITKCINNNSDILEHFNVGMDYTINSIKY